MQSDIGALRRGLAWLGAVACLLFILFIQPSSAFDWPDCKFQCQAKEVVVTKAWLGDANGGDLQGCRADAPTMAYIWAEFYNHASKPRYAVILLADVYVGGELMHTFFDQGVCVMESIPSKATTSVPVYSFPWTCGQEIELRRFVLSWVTASGTTCDNAKRICSNRNTKCYGGLEAVISVNAPLVANFSWEEACMGRQTQFTPDVSGGSPPYDFVWNYGDGSPTVAETRPSHVYEMQASYAVTLQVSDVAGSTASVQKIVTVRDCDPPVVEVKPKETCPDEPLAVSARVNDRGGVAWVKLISPASMEEISMDLVAGTIFDGEWAGSLRPSPAGTSVIYYVMAQDLQGNQVESPQMEASWEDLALDLDIEASIGGSPQEFRLKLSAENSGEAALDEVWMTLEGPPGSIFLSADIDPSSQVSSDEGWAVEWRRSPFQAKGSLGVIALIRAEAVGPMEIALRGGGIHGTCPPLTREATVVVSSHREPVLPIFDCLEERPGGELLARYGYINPNPYQVIISIGPFNSIHGGIDGAQPTEFSPGGHSPSFVVEMSGEGVAWELDGTTSSATDLRCIDCLIEGPNLTCTSHTDTYTAGSGDFLAIVWLVDGAEARGSLSDGGRRIDVDWGVYGEGDHMLELVIERRAGDHNRCAMQVKVIATPVGRIEMVE
ncbi:MAG: PKD domain-containing protein [Methanotrichaceae archaeon]|nr:PKD domain-containing protein [Methanotrichaceae archaeon]